MIIDPTHALNAITVIDMSNQGEGDVQDVKTYINTDVGRKLAEATFRGWCIEASGDDKPSDKDLDDAWQGGRFEIGLGCIMVVYSG